MQSIDLSNILFGKACRECCKHGPVQEVRPHKYVEQRCSYYRYHDDDVWKHHRGIFWHHYDREEQCQGFQQLITWLSGPRWGWVKPLSIRSIMLPFLTHYIDSCLMPKKQKTPDCAKICSENLNLVRILQELCTTYLSYTLRIVVKPPVHSISLSWYNQTFYFTFAIIKKTLLTRNSIDKLFLWCLNASNCSHSNVRPFQKDKKNQNFFPSNAFTIIDLHAGANCILEWTALILLGETHK